MSMGTMRSHASADWGASRAPTASCVTAPRVSVTSPGRIPASRHSSASESIAICEKRSVSAAPEAATVRGRPRKVMPNALTKHAAASAAEQARVAPTAGTSSLATHCGSCGLKKIAWNVSHSETKPLKGGSAEMAMHPGRNGPRRSRHGLDQSAEVLHVAFAGRIEHRSGAHEQQTLEERVIEYVEDRRRERQRRRGAQAARLERQGETQADEDDADVLDGVVREEALQVVLHQRVQDAQQCGDRGDHQYRNALMEHDLKRLLAYHTDRKSTRLNSSH